MRILCLLSLCVGAVCTLPEETKAGGCGYYQPTYYSPPSYNSYPTYNYNYVTPVIATYIPIAVPQYSISYVQPAVSTTTTVQTTAVPQVQATVAATATQAQTVAAAAPSACDQKLAMLQSDFIQMQKSLLQCQQQMLQMQNGGGQQPPVAPQAAKPPASPQAVAPQMAAPQMFSSIVVAKCAACHDATTAEKEGKGLVLTKGGAAVPLDPKMATKVITQTYSGKMPKKTLANGSPSGVQPLTDEEVSAVVAYVDSMK